MLRQTTGSGELWVDSNGLPRRQIMDLHLPGVSAGYDAQMHLSVDFSRYGDPVAAITLPQPIGPGGALVMPAAADAPPVPDTSQPAGVQSAAVQPNAESWIGQALAYVAGPLRRTGALSLSMLPAIVLLFLLFITRRRSFYVAVVSALILVMVSQPLLEAGRMVRFSRRAAEAAPLADALTSFGASDSARNSAMPAASQLARLPGADDVSLKDCHVLFTDAGYSPSGDEDGDGLDNETEWCLGTDFRNADSDSDSITDTLEVEGFVYANQTWIGNPLESDSNRDGVSDGAEWPVDLTGSDFEDVVDYDNDGVPNLWDDDNDGDGVPDDQDISIYSVSAYRTSFDLEVTSHSTGTYVYVDLQVQPQTSLHLRYNLSTLDWPADDLGQIQDLDNSTEDITLIPFLDIDSPISPTLSNEYGIASHLAQGSNPDGQYQLLVPLQPVLDRGDVHAFSARLAFTSDEAEAGIALRNGRIVWMVEGVLDQYVTSCQAGDADCTCAEGDDTSCVLAQNSLLTQYPEEYLRLTGLQFSESMDVTTGVFGTGTNLPQVSSDPNQDDEDKVMMSLMSAGLAGSFLGFQHPDLDEIAANFGNPAAQPPFTPTWGINPAVMHVVTGTYAHRDEAMATTTQTTTVAFLDQNYVDCTVNTTNQLTPTLALALEETSAAMSLSDPHLTIVNNDSGVASSAPLQISAPLADMPLGVLRYTQLQSYGCAIDDSGQAGWQVLSLGGGLAEVNRRYADDFSQPWFGAVQQMFMINYQGRANYITVGGVLMPDIGEAAAADEFAALVDNQTTTMPDYVRVVYQLDPLVLKIDELGTANGYWDWSGSLGQQQNNTYYWTSASVLALKIVGALARQLRWSYLTRNPPIRVVQVAPDDLTVPQVQEFANRYFDGDAEALVADFDSDVPASAFIRQVKDQGYFEVPEVNYRALGTAKIEGYNNIGKGTAVLGALAYVVAEVSIWIQYAASIRGATSIQKEIALSQAISATILLTVQVLISIVRFLYTWFNAIWGSLNNSVDLLVLLIIYIIVAAISHDWNPAHTTDELAKLILNVNVLAKIPDNGVNTGPLNMRIEPGSSGIDGPLAGNWFNITTTVSTTVQLNSTTQEEKWYKDTDVGSSDDVKKSWAYVRWSALDQSSPQYPTYLSQYLITNTLPVFGQNGAGANTHCYADGQVVGDSSVFTGTEKDCINDVSLAFKPGSAGRNAAAPFQNTIEQNLRYQKCWWDVVGY
ncbi:MAG: thrombospondin type 3 repeat-containing protein, partial [Anaerolineae bacterium]|nr:thrombospondin type 3 repeat-containing protein [Anaerolineae bacterium]